VIVHSTVRRYLRESEAAAVRQAMTRPTGQGIRKLARVTGRVHYSRVLTGCHSTVINAYHRGHRVTLLSDASANRALDAV
jgi:hypothetical protein